MPVAKGGRLIRGNDAARFVSKVAQVGECLEWQGPLNERGYGKFMVGPAGNQKTWIAHRWVYFNATGERPDVVRHRCDNPRCVRIEHLEPGTQRDNVHDALDRGRRKQTLTPDIVARLRVVRDSGASVRAEARRLGVPYEAAYQAAARKTWRHIP